MAGEVLDTRVWVPTPAAPTQSYVVGAGVSGAVSVQVTNNSLGEVWMNDSGAIPRSADSAKYVIPPRATATFPLGAAQVSLRWNSLASGVADLVTFVFSDGVQAPNVLPGVSSIGGNASPLQSLASSFPQGVGTWPQTLTTTSGKNVGSIFVYNQTRVNWRLFIPNPSSRYVTIPPYSWVTLPVNLPSGIITINFTNVASLIQSYLQNDTFYIAWGDIDFTAPFPSGAGPTANPYTQMPAAIRGLPTQQIFASTGSLAAVVLPLYTIGPAPGVTNPQRVLLTDVATGCTSAGGAAASRIDLSRGYDGLSGVAVPICEAGAGPIAGDQQTVSRGSSIIEVTNYDPVLNNVIQLVTVGAISRGDGHVGGYILS